MCSTSYQSADAAMVPPTAFGDGGDLMQGGATSTSAEGACQTTSSLTSEEKALIRKLKAAEKARAKTEERLLSQVRAQGLLHKTMCQEATNGSYFNLPSGRVLHRETCERLIEAGRLVALKDGLFDDSQTFVAGPQS